MSGPPHRKVMIIGDPGVGKTRLIDVKLLNGWSEATQGLDRDTGHHIPLEVNGVPVTLDVHDTAGQDEFDRVRSLMYPQTDVFVVCFSLVSRVSLDNIRTKWYNEMKYWCPRTPFIVVGLKEDLRHDAETLHHLNEDRQSVVSSHEGEALATALAAARYLECSSRTGQGVGAIFQVVGNIAFAPPRRHRHSRCIIM